MTPRWPPLPRRLPRTPAPLRYETYESYLNRLAAANRLGFDDLDEVAHFYDDDPAVADQLAALTGYPAAALLRAIPELFHQRALSATALAGRCPIPKEYINDIRAPCRRCAAAHGADPDIARVWATHDVNVCVRHRLWIGDGDDQPPYQPGLLPCPDIVHAQIRHQRILRSRGRPATRSAFHAARGLWAYMSTTPGYTWQRDSRTARICPRASSTTSEETISNAVTYPETVALTAILASPAWRTIALSRKPADNRRFHHEFRRRVSPGHTDNGYPRLLYWIRRDLERGGTRDTDDYPPPRSAISPQPAARHRRLSENAS